MLEKLRHRIRCKRHGVEDIVERKENAIIWHLGGGWGNHIHWFTFRSGEVTHIVYGHLPGIFPVVGDELQAKMKSRKTARFIFTKIEPQRDPRDMFFADVKFIAYVGEALNVI